MALNTTRRRTKAALGTDADDTDAAVEVKLERNREEKRDLTIRVFVSLRSALLETYSNKRGKENFYSHNRYDFTEAQSDPVHLGDEYACHGHEQRRPVHVNIATDRQNESGHSRIDSKFVRHQAKSDGKCGSPVQNYIRENRGKRGRVE